MTFVRNSLLLAALPIALAAGAFGQSFTFAGSTWDQTHTPEVRSYLGGGAVIGGATFSAGDPTTATSGVGFPLSQVGFDKTLGVGHLANPSVSATGPRALNLPAGNNGSTTRHGVEFSWGGPKALVNEPGFDMVVYESGSAGEPEGLMFSAKKAADGTWTPWFYVAPQAYEDYTNSSTTGAFATSIDFDALGVPVNAAVTALRIANLRTTDRINGVGATAEGEVLPEIGGTGFPEADPGPTSTNATYAAAAYDPDPVYVAALRAPIVACAATTPFGPSAGAFANTFSGTLPILGTLGTLTLSNAEPNTQGFVIYGFPSAPIATFPGLTLNLGNGQIGFLLEIAVDGAGNWSYGAVFPNDPALHCIVVHLQAITLGGSGFGSSNGLTLTLGYL